MKALIIAEHDDSAVHASTLVTVSAAAKVGADVHVLVAGNSADDVANRATQIRGISKAVLVDAPHSETGLTTNFEATILALVEGYPHYFSPATAFGKNIAPRVAVRLDVAQVSDVTAVLSHDTFDRPTNAGNAIATVHSSDQVKVVNSYDVVRAGHRRFIQRSC